MAPIPGPKAQTDAELKEEVRDWTRKFDAAVLPSDKEVVTGILTGIGIVAAIILLPLSCSLIST